VIVHSCADYAVLTIIADMRKTQSKQSIRLHG
jgi:hypothetical protein